MSKYILKKDRKPMKPIMHLKKLREDNQKLKDIIEGMKRFMLALGFRSYYKAYWSFGTYYHHALKDCSVCGSSPFISEDPYEIGMFYVECYHCAAHTKNHNRIKDAIIAWNKGERTELSKMLSKPLTKDNMDINGARNLVLAMGKQAAKDYKKSVIKGEPDKKIANFLEGIHINGMPAVEVLTEEALSEEVEEDEEP